MNKHIGPVLGAVAGVLLVVGAVATAQAMTGDTAPTPQPSVVQPGAQTATPDPIVTTTATATATPKPAPAPVESTTSAPAKKAPAPVQRQAVVSEPAPETTTQPPAQPAAPTPGQPVQLETGNAPTGYFGPTPTSGATGQ